MLLVRGKLKYSHEFLFTLSYPIYSTIDGFIYWVSADCSWECCLCFEKWQKNEMMSLNYILHLKLKTKRFFLNSCPAFGIESTRKNCSFSVAEFALKISFWWYYRGMSAGLVEKSESKTDWVKRVLYEIHFGKLIPLINFRQFERILVW